VQRYLVTRAATRTVTNGDALLSRLGRPRGRAVVSASLYANEVNSVTRRRTPDAAFRVLFVGYLRPEKNFEVLFRAFARLLHDVADAELCIVGAPPPVERGSSRQVLELLAPIRERVRFLGHVPFGPALFECYADADVLALPSFSEGTPRVLIEARAFGCPVVASDVGGIPTSVTHEVDGLLVAPRDVAQWHAALLRLWQDTKLRRSLTARGIETARRHTVEQLADALLEEATAALADRAR
jgi:glycosyltransferase involved in cell wall biosynthesis